MKAIDLTLGTYSDLDTIILKEDVIPCDYVRKDGSILDVYLVKINFDNIEAADTCWMFKRDAVKARINDKVKRFGGWYDRNRKGFLLRSQNSALAIAKTMTWK